MIAAPGFEVVSCRSSRTTQLAHKIKAKRHGRIPNVNDANSAHAADSEARQFVIART
jgi:hypothetical protein